MLISQIWKQSTSGKIKITTIWAKSVTKRRTSSTQMSFGSGLMKVLSVSSSPFMHLGFGLGLANKYICLLLYHINHIKEAKSPGEFGHTFIVKAEKFFPPCFLFPKSCASVQLWGWALRRWRQYFLAHTMGARRAFLVMPRQVMFLTILAKM